MQYRSNKYILARALRLLQLWLPNPTTTLAIRYFSSRDHNIINLKLIIHIKIEIHIKKKYIYIA